MFRIIAALLVFLASVVQCAAQGLPAPSYWQNQRGSIMKILALDPSTGNFSGIYINNAVGFRCQGTPYDLQGRARGPNVVFRVVWKNWAEDCKSTTVWYGRLVGTTLYTKWVLTRVGITKKLKGTDTFQRN